MINKVTLIGNLGKDPEVRKLENGASVAKFTVATNESYKDKDGNWQSLTDWHDIVAWRNLAEQAERTLKKGSLVFIEGKISHRKYTDSNNIERRVTEIVAQTLKSLDRREGGGNQNSFPSTNDEPSSHVPFDPSPSADDDLPF
ncbi:MAG: single-stranded DNA-binding protein [Saprospiraceae bacterium]|jgi:single-strand DNA-binding protein|nr:single-stranded DNA-binding protein [Saprospiraceae bacterium]